MVSQIISRLLLLLFCLSMMIASAKANIQEAINYYENRNDKTVSNQYIDKAINIFSQELDNNESNKNIVLYILKCYYYKGEYILNDIKEKKTIFTLGKQLGEKYIKKFPNSVELRYWYLANLGSWAKVYGIMSAAREGVADIIKQHSEQIIELDPQYFNGGGYFMLGAIHLKSPYIPFLLSWPDNNKAIEYLKLATQTGKPTLKQKLYLARAFKKNKELKKAKILLNEIINSIPDPNYFIEELTDIKNAKKLLENF